MFPTTSIKFDPNMYLLNYGNLIQICIYKVREIPSHLTQLFFMARYLFFSTNYSRCRSALMINCFVFSIGTCWSRKAEKPSRGHTHTEWINWHSWNIIRLERLLIQYVGRIINCWGNYFFTNWILSANKINKTGNQIDSDNNVNGD